MVLLALSEKLFRFSDLEECLGNAKFAYKTTYSKHLQGSPFNLLYGLDPYLMTVHEAEENKNIAPTLPNTKENKSLFAKINMLRTKVIT